MAKYNAVTTDAGIEFEVGLRSIEKVEDEYVQGAPSGYVLIYKEGKLHARVMRDKVDVFYYTK